jgi:hypothetical protein
MDRRTDGALMAVMRAIEDNRRALSELRLTVHNISRALEDAKNRPHVQDLRRPAQEAAEDYDHQAQPRGAHSIRPVSQRVPTFSERQHGPSVSRWENVSAAETNTDRDYDYFAELDERLAGMTPRGPRNEPDTGRPGGVAHLRRA